MYNYNEFAPKAIQCTLGVWFHPLLESKAKGGKEKVKFWFFFFVFFIFYCDRLLRRLGFLGWLLSSLEAIEVGHHGFLH